MASHNAAAQPLPSIAPSAAASIVRPRITVLTLEQLALDVEFDRHANTRPLDSERIKLPDHMRKDLVVRDRPPGLKLVPLSPAAVRREA
jgi:hypothetical protein